MENYFGGDNVKKNFRKYSNRAQIWLQNRKCRLNYTEKKGKKAYKVMQN